MIVFENTTLTEAIEILVEKFGRDRSASMSILQGIPKKHQ